MVSPNTPPPRPASPSPQPSSNDPRSQPLHSSSSSSDGSTRCADIPPTWPRARALNVRRAPAVAILPHCAPADHRLSELSLDISWRPDDNAACFRLHTHIWLVRASSGQSDGTRTPVLPSGSRVFIHISPESIVRLEIDRRPAETPFGRSTAAFKFTLSAPPGLVVPKTSTGTYTHRARKTSDEDEQNENSTSARRDQLLRRLAGSKMITVLAKVDQKSLPASQADLFCAALASGNMVADPHLADISSLYWGQGGEVINCSTLDPKSEVSPAPAYEYDSGDEAQLPRYSERNTSGADTPSVSRGHKRPRVASSSTDSVSESPPLKRYIEGAVPSASPEARFEACLAGLEARLFAAIESSQAALRSEVLAHLETTKRDILARLDVVENVAVEQAATSVAQMEEDILSRLDEADVSIAFDGSVGARLVFHGL